MDHKLPEPEIIPAGQLDAARLYYQRQRSKSEAFNALTEMLRENGVRFPGHGPSPIRQEYRVWRSHHRGTGNR